MGRVEEPRSREQRLLPGWMKVGVDQWILTGTPILSLYAAHILSGFNQPILALWLAAFSGGLLLLYLTLPAGRRISTLPALPVIGGLFLLTVAVALWSLTPFVPGGPNPLWAFQDGPGAATIDRTATVIEIVKLMGLGAIFLVGAILGLSSGPSRLARFLLIGGGVVFALAALATHGAVTPLLESHKGRLSGGFGSPNSAGTMFAILMVLSLSILGSRPVTSRTAIERAILAYAPGVGLLILFAGCLILTGSRGALVSAVAGMAVFLGLQLLSGRVTFLKAGAGILVVSIVGAAVVLMKGDLAIARFGKAAEDANLRAQLFDMHWQAFLASPMNGYGLGAFQSVHKLILDLPNYAQLWRVAAQHNVYLQWLLEGGILGAAPMFLCIALIVGIVLLRFNRRSADGAWVRALAAANVVILVHGISDYALQVPSIAAFWALLLGLQLGLVTAPPGSRGRRSSLKTAPRGA